MEESVEVLVVITSGVIGLSHILQHRLGRSSSSSCEARGKQALSWTGF
jgi:hypothetical protein